MLEGKYYPAMMLKFPVIGAYIDAPGFRNEAIVTGVHRIYSDIVSKVMSQNYDREWSVAKLEILRNVGSAFKPKVVNTFSPVCTSGLVTLKFQLLDHLVEDVLRFGCLSVLNALPYK